jgi:mRNA-degrading endonuclease toxin of MazEF toxin-antitoxin module
MAVRRPPRGDDFANGQYVPELGHVVHMNWNPAIGHEMKGPHYALVVSATLFNQGTGLAVLRCVTSKVGKLSAFEFTISAGRVNGVAILSDLRSIDYQERSVQYEAATVAISEANRRIRMIFP